MYICIYSLFWVYLVVCYVRKSILGMCEEKFVIILFLEVCIFGGKNFKDICVFVCNWI